MIEVLSTTLKITAALAFVFLVVGVVYTAYHGKPADPLWGQAFVGLSVVASLVGAILLAIDMVQAVIG